MRRTSRGPTKKIRLVESQAPDAEPTVLLMSIDPEAWRKNIARKLRATQHNPDAWRKIFASENRAWDRRAARAKRLGLWPTDEKIRRWLARTPVVRPRGDWGAFLRRLATDASLEAEGGLPDLLAPLLAALDAKLKKAWLLNKKKALPRQTFNRYARIFLEFIHTFPFMMPLAPMPRHARSAEAFEMKKPPDKRAARRLARRLSLLGLHAEAQAIVGKSTPRRRAQSWPAHAEFVWWVRLLTGKPFFRQLAALLTAAHRAHGNEDFYLDERGLRNEYRSYRAAKRAALRRKSHLSSR